MAKFSTPRMRVTLDDGTELDIQTTHADAVRYDISRARFGWPAVSDAPMLWTSFLAWAAIRRMKLADLPEAPDGLDRIVAIEYLTADGQVVEADSTEAKAVGPDPTTETA